MTSRSRLLVPLVLMVATACADDAPDTGGPDAAATVTVRIERSRFSDPELAVSPGTAVVFVNDDAVAHTVTARDDAPLAFDSGDLGQGDTVEVTFDAPGTHRYFCEIHPTMRAVVIVA